MRLLFLALAACVATTSVLASENGTQHYPVGINTVTAGNMPPPGTLEYMNYMQEASMTALNGPPAPEFGLTAITNASRLLYTWPSVSMSGLNVSTGLVIPVVHLDMRVGGLHGSAFNLGDIDIQNYVSGADSSHTLFYFAGFDVNPPTGRYDRGAIINTGNNHYTLTPNAGFTWMPSKLWEVTGAVASEFNTVNPATHYRSGNDIDVDYAVTYRPLAGIPAFGVGVQGYAFQQLGDDFQNGTKVGADGHRGREFGIGPQLRYDMGIGGLVLKYQHLFAVRNRPSGERVWFQFAVPLFSAGGS
jgi:hypothetical protein